MGIEVVAPCVVAQDGIRTEADINFWSYSWLVDRRTSITSGGCLRYAFTHRERRAAQVCGSRAPTTLAGGHALT